MKRGRTSRVLGVEGGIVLQQPPSKYTQAEWYSMGLQAKIGFICSCLGCCGIFTISFGAIAMGMTVIAFLPKCTAPYSRHNSSSGPPQREWCPAQNEANSAIEKPYPGRSAQGTPSLPDITAPPFQEGRAVD